MSSNMFANLSHVMRTRDPSHDERRTIRDLVDLVSHVTARGRTHGVRIINVSPLGLMCRSDADLLVGEKLTIWLPLVHNIQAQVRWAENGRFGLEYRTPIPITRYASVLELMPARRVAW